MSEFRCQRCGEVYAKGWTDDEAAAEFREQFPGFGTEECALVCSECYGDFMIWMAKQRRH